MTVVTVVISPTGALRLASDRISEADADRWVSEGFAVFRIAAHDALWAVHHVNSHGLYGPRVKTASPPELEGEVEARAAVALLPAPDHPPKETP